MIHWQIIEHQGKRKRVAVAANTTGTWVGWLGGTAFVAKTTRHHTGSDVQAATSKTVVAPMTGKIIKVLAEAGTKVEEGSLLVVMEAMKMEYRLTAPCSGIVQNVMCQVGALVDLGALLVELT